MGGALAFTRVGQQLLLLRRLHDMVSHAKMRRETGSCGALVEVSTAATNNTLCKLVPGGCAMMESGARVAGRMEGCEQHWGPRAPMLMFRGVSCRYIKEH